jgi:hypothetical protein
MGIDLRNVANHQLLDDLAEGKKLSTGVYRMFSESVGRKNQRKKILSDVIRSSRHGLPLG